MGNQKNWAGSQYFEPNSRTLQGSQSFENSTWILKMIYTKKQPTYSESNLTSLADLRHVATHDESFIMNKSYKLHRLDTHTCNGLDETKRACQKPQISEQIVHW